MPKEIVRKAIVDGDGNNVLASVVQSIADPTKYGLVVCKPDGSPIGGGGGGGTYTADNGLTMTGTNIQLGGEIIQDTLIQSSFVGHQIDINTIKGGNVGVYFTNKGETSYVQSWSVQDIANGGQRRGHNMIANGDTTGYAGLFAEDNEGSSVFRITGNRLLASAFPDTRADAENSNNYLCTDDSGYILSKQFNIGSGIYGQLQMKSGSGIVGIGAFYDATAQGYLGIGVQSPTSKLHIYGTGANGGIRSNIGLDVVQVTAPDSSLLTLTPASGSSLSVGQYYYCVTYYTAIGETNKIGYSGILTTTGKTTVNISSIPISSDPSVVGRKIYRGKVGDSTSYGSLIATIANNVTTTYTDTTPDSSLPEYVLDRAIYSKINTTSNILSVNGGRAIIVDGFSTGFGIGVMQTLTTGGGLTVFGAYAGNSVTKDSGHCFFGTGAGRFTKGVFQNVAIGQDAYGNGQGSYNIAIGPNVLYKTTGSNNIAGGYYAGSAMDYGDGNLIRGGYAAQYRKGGNYNVNLGYYSSSIASSPTSYGIYLGAYSGWRETTSGKLIIDSYSRATEAEGRTSAIIYGELSDTPSAQKLFLGGGGKVSVGQTGCTSVFNVAGLLDYASNALALAGGLTTGAFYYNSTLGNSVCVVV